MEVVGDVVVDDGVAGICGRVNLVIEHSFKFPFGRGSWGVKTYCDHQQHDSRESPAATAYR